MGILMTVKVTYLDFNFCCKQQAFKKSLYVTLSLCVNKAHIPNSRRNLHPSKLISFVMEGGIPFDQRSVQCR